MTNTTETIKKKLARGRAKLLETVAQLDDGAWETAVFPAEDNPDEHWTALDVLHHLADAEQNLTRLVTSIRDGGEGAPTDFDVNRWNNRFHQKKHPQTKAEILTQLEQSREQLLSLIDTFSEDDWQKQGRHPTQKMVTLAQFLGIMAAHEIWHTKDMRRAMRKT